MIHKTEWMNFLASSDWLPDKTESLAGDASTRKYIRIYKNDKSAIFMDSSTEMEKISAFIKISLHLQKLGLSAPKIYNTDLKNGFLLLEDFGNNSIYSLAKNNLQTSQLHFVYEKILDTLHVIQAAPIPSSTPVYTNKRLIKDATEFFSYWYPQIASSVNHSVAQAEFSQALKPAMSEAWKLPAVLSLRDFHAGNLMWLANRDCKEKIGLLDFQDAISAPSTYDIMSLLCDARLQLSKALTKKIINQHLKANPHIDPLTFSVSYAALGAQRAFRIIGVFTRLALICDKPHYQKYIPHVWEHVYEHVSHPKLYDLRQWLLEFVPSSRLALVEQ
jgi:aminoglycoside/choline kinase family phosphotransferase